MKVSSYNENACLDFVLFAFTCRRLEAQRRKERSEAHLYMDVDVCCCFPFGFCLLLTSERKTMLLMNLARLTRSENQLGAFCSVFYGGFPR